MRLVVITNLITLSIAQVPVGFMPNNIVGSIISSAIGRGSKGPNVDAADVLGKVLGSVGLDKSRRIESVTQGLSGPKLIGDSCLSKPRDPIKGVPGVNVKLLKDELHDCEEILHHQVDISDGCVYKFHDVYMDVWSPHPIHLLEHPTKLIYKEKATLVTTIRTTSFPCDKSEKNNNKIKLIAMKQRCIMLRREFQKQRCPPCHLQALLTSPQRSRIESCAVDSMTPATIGLSHLYVRKCTEKIAAKETTTYC